MNNTNTDAPMFVIDEQRLCDKAKSQVEQNQGGKQNSKSRLMAMRNMLR
jgi:hypothetical protein